MQFGNYHVPLFQVAANPQLLTGANNALKTYDTPYLSSAATYQERPSVCCINMPTRTTGTEFPGVGVV